MEVVHLQSGFVRLREFLRCGLRCWNDGEESGYPVWHISRAGHLFLTPDGDTMEERRRDRVALWQASVGITLFHASPEHLGRFYGGCAIGFPAMRTLHELSEGPYRIAPPLEALLRHLGRNYSGFERCSAAYSIEPCALPLCRDDAATAPPMASPPKSVRLLLRLPPAVRPTRLQINGKDAEPQCRQDGQNTWLAVHVPLHPETPIGDFLLEYPRTV